VAWEQRGNTRYYYKSVRDGASVKKVYLGRDSRAEVAQLQAAEIRSRREAELATLVDLETQLGPLDAAMDQLDAGLADLTSAFMMIKGFYKHHGQWRPRHEQPRN